LVVELKKFKVSVVIPVYNARDYVTDAVESAVVQPETGEVILVEDNSPDNGIEVCRSLAERLEKVQLLQHPDGKNHGAAASRNLGIINAGCPYIAFLDADDYYLQNRFSKTTEVFSEQPDADGVYEAIGVHFEDEEAIKSWEKVNLQEITTVNREVPPEELFEKILFGGVGYFSFDGFTGKRQLFSKVGMFNENLRYLEDTELAYKLAVKSQLYPGSINEPIAIRRVHRNNRITNLLNNKREIYKYNYQLWDSLMDWSMKNLSREKQTLIALRFVERLRKADYFDDFLYSDYLKSRKKMMKLGIKNPKLFVNLFFWRMIIPSRTLLKYS